MHITCTRILIFIYYMLCVQNVFSCESEDLSASANEIFSQTKFCFPEQGQALDRDLIILRANDTNDCDIYWLVKRRGWKQVPMPGQACSDFYRRGPGEHELDKYIDHFLKTLNECKGDWVERDSEVVQGLGLKADEQALQLTRHCLQRYLRSGTSSRHAGLLKVWERTPRRPGAAAAGALQRGRRARRDTLPWASTTSALSLYPHHTIPPSPLHTLHPLPGGFSKVEMEFQAPGVISGAEALFSVRVFGPRTLLAGAVVHKADETFVVTFWPAEAGAHQVHVRLEYNDFGEAVTGILQQTESSSSQAGQSWAQIQARDKLCVSHGCTGRAPVRSAQWVGADIPVLTVDVPRQPEAERTQESRPVCSGGTHVGFWSHIPGSAPPLESGSDPGSNCPKTCEDPQALVCKTPVPVGRNQLYTHQPRDWLQYTAWEAYHCRYLQYGPPELSACLAGSKPTETPDTGGTDIGGPDTSKRARRRVMVVGDSVSLQLCTWMQCAMMKARGQTGCDSACSHRTWPRNEYKQPLAKCTESQDGKSPDIVCVAIENFVGPFLTECRGADCYHMRSISDIWKAFSPKEVQYNIKAALRRHGMGKGDTHDVLVLSAGLHDGTYVGFPNILQTEGSPWERLLQAVVQVGREQVEIMDHSEADSIGNQGSGGHRSTLSQVIWHSPPAVHTFAEWTTNCSDIRGRHPSQGANCRRLDYDPKSLLSGPRSMLLNSFIRDVVVPRVNGGSGGGLEVELLDMWSITQTREDNTAAHSDKTHPCGQVYREVAQVIFNMICN